MATTIEPRQATEQVWHQLARRSFAVGRRVAVTVPVRRGGILSLVTPIPPATISFHGTAILHPAGSAEAGTLARELGSLLPAERRASACIIEISPRAPSSPTGWACGCCACAPRPRPGPACRWAWPGTARWAPWPSHGAWSG
jgi:hypothetical protein